MADDTTDKQDQTEPEQEQEEEQASPQYRVKTPTILQMEATECGAASLGIVLGYHGLHLSLEKLREECGVSRDGSKAINMLKAARRFGMKAQGAKVEDPNDLTELALPVIAFWEFNHFVVVEGVRGDTFYINDPATGPRTVTREEFDRAFTGVVLTFEPDAGFKKSGHPLSIIKVFKERLEGSMTPLLYIFLGSLALVIPGVIIPGFSKVFIDDILIRGIHSWLNLLIAGIIFTAVLRALLGWLQQKCLLQLHLKLMLVNSAKFLWHVLHLPVVFFQQRFAGDLQVRVGANDRIAQLLSGQITDSAVSMISMVFYAAVMFLLTWQLSVIAVLVAGCNIILFYTIARRIADSSRRFLQQQGRLSGVEMSGLHMIETLKATGSEDVFFSRWASEHAQTINSQQRIMMLSTVLQIIPSFLSGLTTVVILGWGAWLVMQGSLTVGTLVAFQALVASFMAPLNTLLGLAQQTQQIRGDLMRLDDVLKYPTDYEETRDESQEEEQLSGELAVNSVNFGYSRLEEPYVQDFNLHLKPGQRFALVGHTGSGKSTIIRLISRLYKPWSGSIELGGQPLDNIPAKQLSRSVAMVDQDIFLFSGTVRENLTLWNPDVDDETLHRVLRDACVEDVVIARGGLDSRIAEGGANYSGGQRQRLEIARALVYNPSLLILDEATSSLDPAIELDVYNNIKKRDCSMLIVAHRLSAIRDCDEIIVMDSGRVVERGQHQQLIEQKGPYQQLLQTGE